MKAVLPGVVMDSPAPGKGVYWGFLYFPQDSVPPILPLGWLLGLLYITTPNCHIRKFNCTLLEMRKPKLEKMTMLLKG